MTLPRNAAATARLPTCRRAGYPPPAAASLARHMHAVPQCEPACRKDQKADFRISDFGLNWTFHPEQGAFPNQCQVSTEPRLGVPQTPFRIR